MKLLQIIYPGLGGHSSVATSLISGDEQNKYEHFLLGYGIEKPSENLDSYNCDYVLKNQGLDLKSYRTVFKKIKVVKPDAVIVHSTSQILTVFFYSLFHRIKWLAVEHQANNAKNKIDWLYSFIILLLAPKVVYLTEAYKEQMLERFPYLVRRKNCKVIGNGIDLKKFSPQPTEPSQLIRLTMISRLNKLRDHKTLIDAFAELANTHENLRLTIAGDGETFAEINNHISNLNLQHKISMTGFLTEDQVLKLLHETDIYIHSSLAETQSTSLLQVMACKIPIIATNIDGISSILIHNKEALLFECFDKNELIRWIHLLITDSTLKFKLIENSYLKIKESFSSQKMFTSYLNFINDK